MIKALTWQAEENLSTWKPELSPNNIFQFSVPFGQKSFMDKCPIWTKVRPPWIEAVEAGDVPGTKEGVEHQEEKP